MEFFSEILGGEMDAAAMRRVALNQANLRKVNEGIDAERDDGLTAFLCECGILGCNRLVMLSRPQYEAVRVSRRRFLVAPGHVVSELEHVVEQHAEHAVVETHQHTSELAEQTYPREGGTD
jgi:hypothetical protein